MQSNQVASPGVACERIDPGISPHIAAIAAEAAELDVVAVRTLAALEHEDQLVLAAVQGSHPAIVLGPDTQVLQLQISLPASCEQLLHMPPVHANIEQRATEAERGVVADTACQEQREGRSAHFADR